MGWFDPERAWRWRRPPDTIAVRFSASKGSEVFKNGLVVETGTRGLLIHDGRIDGEIGPGRHDFETVQKQFRNLEKAPEFEVVLFPAGEVRLAFAAPPVSTKDEVRVRALCSIIIEIENGSVFTTKCLENRVRMTLEDLRDRISPWVLDELGPQVLREELVDLAGDMSITQRIESECEARLSQSLKTFGLSLAAFTIQKWSSQEIEKIADIRRAGAMVLSEKDAETEVKEKLLEAWSGEQDLDLRERRKKLDVHKKKREIWEDLQRTVVEGKRTEALRSRELEEFFNRLDTDRLMDKAERDELVRGIEERKDDNARQRRFIIEKAEVNHKVELDWIALETDVSRRRLLKKTEIDLQEEENEAKVRHLGNLVDLRAKKKESDQDRRLREEERKQALRIKEKQTETELKIKQQESHAAIMKELAPVVQGLSIEALVALADADSKAFLVEMHKNATFKDMSEGQLLALAAQTSQAAAEVVARVRERESADTTRYKESLDQHLGLFAEAFKAAVEKRGEPERSISPDQLRLFLEALRAGIESQRK